MGGESRERPSQRVVGRLREVRRYSRHSALTAAAAGLALAPASIEASFLGAAFAVAALAVLRAPRLALVAGAIVLSAALVGHARLQSIDRPGLRVRSGDRVQARAQLVSRPRDGRFGPSAEVRLATGAAKGARLLARLPRQTRVPAAAGPGSELALAGVVRPPPRHSGYAAYLRRRGFTGELAVERARFTGRGRGGPAGALDAIRRRAERGLTSGLAPAPADLALGMVLGQDERIDSSVRDDFRASGLAHVLAVSGQNVMLLAALAMVPLTAVGLAPAARIAITLALVGLYVPLAGAGLPLQRAGVMGAASLAALALARPASRTYALLLAAATTLALDPRACADPGWQLSFAAVAGILALGPPLRRSLGPLPHLVRDGISVTLAATLATAPLVAHHFGSVAVAGLAANVAALPLVAPIMWLGMLRAGAGQLEALGAPGERLGHALGAPLGLVLEPLVRALGWLAATFADLPGGQLTLPLHSGAGLVLGYVALAAAAGGARAMAAGLEPRTVEAAARWRRLPRARRRGVVMVAAALVTVVFVQALTPPGPPHALTVSFLDVGQGDATLIQHPDGAAVLFDGGPPEGRIARQLRRAGVRRLSVLVMTHASRDHHGGLRQVAEQIPIDLLLDGGDGTRDPDFRRTVREAVRRGARRVRAVAPMALRAGGIAIRIMSPRPRPPGPPPEDPNPRAVAAIVATGGFKLLLSADAESPSLLGLSLPDVDAMKLPHHGSDDPGLPELLDRLRPEVAAITVGQNTYGHPAPSTLAALRRARAPILRTDRDGTVRLVVKDGRVRVQTGHG